MDNYSILGSYYDALVGDENVVLEWIDWIEKHHPGKDFLELACGSGAITARLAKNHQVDAMDLSPQMLERARAKVPPGSVRFSSGDMRDLSAYGMYDAIGCFCDSFNYLSDPEEIEPFFDEVADHLRPSGLFFFDTHGMDRLREFEQEYEEAGQFEDGTQVQWVISSQDELIYQDFAFYLENRTLQEHHMQRVYDPVRLEKLLSKRFEVLDVTGDFGKEPVESAEKVFFVCRKKEEKENES